MAQNVFDELRRARNEISKLQKQLHSLKIQQDKQFREIRTRLNEFECNTCSRCNSLKLKPIAHISTDFPERKAIPRQSAINSNSIAKIVFDKTVLSNPIHAFEGLDQFSHLCKRMLAKVCPPRLNGKKLGVFATRSPNRPCPVGLSLVKLESYGNDFIVFSGVDMLNNTPVIDIKPFIAIYDCPQEACTNIKQLPDWISNTSQLKVVFSDNAFDSLKLLDKNEAEKMKVNISSILQEDPRSVYVRSRFPNDSYTFRNRDFNITCQFDDHSKNVCVLNVVKN